MIFSYILFHSVFNRFSNIYQNTLPNFHLLTTWNCHESLPKMTTLALTFFLKFRLTISAKTQLKYSIIMANFSVWDYTLICKNVSEVIKSKDDDSNRITWIFCHTHLYFREEKWTLNFPIIQLKNCRILWKFREFFRTVWIILIKWVILWDSVQNKSQELSPIKIIRPVSWNFSNYFGMRNI